MLICLQPTQLEVTLLVFLRLAEDVIFSLDSHIHTQRRRNIEQALSENMKEIFNFFITTLQENVGAWRNSVRHFLILSTFLKHAKYVLLEGYNNHCWLGEETKLNKIKLH